MFEHISDISGIFWVGVSVVGFEKVDRGWVVTSNIYLSFEKNW